MMQLYNLEILGFIGRNRPMRFCGVAKFWDPPTPNELIEVVRVPFGPKATKGVYRETLIHVLGKHPDSNLSQQR